MRPLVRLLFAIFLLARGVTGWWRRRFTTNGLLLLLGMVVTLGTAHTEQTLGMPAFLMLGGTLALAMVIAPFFRGRFACERQAPRLVTAGEPFTLRVRVRNDGKKAQRGLDYVEALRDPPLTAGELADALLAGTLAHPRSPLRMARCRPVPLPTLPARGAAEVAVEITAFRRGPLALTGGVLLRSDPLGLFRARRRMPAPQTVLVMPRRHLLPQLDLPGRSQYQQGGVALAAGVGESEEFTALRDYRRGDPLKRVHWRSAARTGRLVVREYQDEYFVRHALVLDTFCTPRQDPLFEEAVAVAASFACTIPDQESLLDLLFVGDTAVCVTSGRGLGTAERMLEVLATVRPNRAPRQAELEALVRRHRPAMSGCILVLTGWDAPRRALVRTLREHHVPVLALLLTVRGQAPSLTDAAQEERPERLVVLEAGRVAEGLATLGSKA